MQIFTILLKSNKKRVANVLRLKSQIETEIVPAVEGNTNELEFLLDGREIHPDYLNFCKRGELACTLSHIKVWKEMIKRNIDSAVILEDDAVIENDFLERIEYAGDFTYLFVHPDCKTRTGTGAHSGLIPGHFTYGTVGYWLTLDSAKELVELFSKEINAPVDKSIAWWLSNSEKEYYCVGENLVETNGQFYHEHPESAIGATDRFKDSVPEFTFYLDEGDYLCFPCVNEAEASPEVLAGNLEQNKSNCHHLDVLGFTSEGHLISNRNWRANQDVAMYLKTHCYDVDNRRPAILLTGGCGYIGSHCLLELLLTYNDRSYGTNYEIVVIDDLSNSDKENLDAIQDLGNVHFYKGDVSEYLDLDPIFRNHNIVKVIHFAGLKSVGESISNPLKYYRNNLIGLINLLECMKEYRVNQLIFSSSATVYGEPSELPLTETSQLSPLNPYGQTKLMSEQIIKDSGVKAIIFRYFNPVGSHECGLLSEQGEANLFPVILSVIKGEREHVPVFGSDYDTVDGTGVRDYIYVTDLVKGHLTGLEYLDNCEDNFSIFNLGTGKGFSVLEVLQEFEKQLGNPVKYILSDRRAGDSAAVWASASLAEKHLKWRAEAGLSEMVSSVLKM